jgi:hypothetical protein
VSVDVRPQVRIRRPRHEVADFMFDPRNDLLWTGGITDSRPAQPGPLVEGATVQRTARFLGRSFTYGYLVTAHEPDALLELEVDRPFPMLVRYELADAGDGATVAAIRATGEPGRFFGWATPLLRRQVQRSISADLERLRVVLEN